MTRARLDAITALAGPVILVVAVSALGSHLNPVRQLEFGDALVNVAMPAGRPERRISGIPAMSANRPPAAAAIASDAAVEVCVWRSTANIDGRIRFFCSTSSVRIPERYAPTATKLIWPNDSTPELPMNT